MDYVLYWYCGVACLFVYAAVWTVGGQRARLVLSLGAYAFHPRYEPPSRRWRRWQREQPHWQRDYAARTAELAEAPTMVLRLETPDPGQPEARHPTLVRAEMSDDGIAHGAEHWGGLLRDMSTEERTIYNAEMVEVHEATKVHERDFLAGLDAAMERFAADLAELDRRHEAIWAGLSERIAATNGGAERWSTGQYVLLPREPELAAA